MLPLTNKLAVITGGSRGIGLAIAHRFVRAGATTYLIARNPGPLDAAVRDLNNAAACSSDSSLFPPSPSSSSSSPIRVKAFSGSVSQEETWLRLIETLNEQRLKVDVLVNAAGMSQGSLLTKTTVDQVDDILNTNLRSAVLGSKFIGKEMVRRPKGERLDGACNIINVSSVMAMRGGTGASVYAASKAGLLGLTSALSQELGHFGVRVNALVPGYIRTDMINHLNEEKLSKQIPLGRTGRAEEVADAAAFLAQNPYANNCVLTIDGGLSAAFSAS